MATSLDEKLGRLEDGRARIEIPAAELTVEELDGASSDRRAAARVPGGQVRWLRP